MAQWIESWPVKQKIAGPIHSQGTIRGCLQVSSWVRARDNRSMFHSFLSLLSPLSKNKQKKELAVGVALSSTYSFSVQTHLDQRSLLSCLGIGSPSRRQRDRPAADQIRIGEAYPASLLNFAAFQRSNLQQCQLMDSRRSSCLTFPRRRQLLRPKLCEPRGFW